MNHHWNVTREFTMPLIVGGSEQELTLAMPLQCEGYYDSGNTCGPPESCYQPEGEDNRCVNGKARIIFKDGSAFDLSEELSKALGELLQDEIDRVNLELPYQSDYDYFD